MNSQHRTISITSLIHRFWRKSMLTWILVLLEGAALVAMPMVIGRSVDGVLNSSWAGVVQLAGLALVLLIVGAGRRFYDTRAYAEIYQTVSRELVDHEKGIKKGLSEITARVNLFSEFIQFMEDSLPSILHLFIGFAGTLAIIFTIDFRVFLACVIAALLVILIYAVSDKKIFILNKGSNDELERQVDVLNQDSNKVIGYHFKNLAAWQIKLSDLETLNFSLFWSVLTVVILYTVVVVSTNGAATMGQILAAVMYVFGFSENVLTFPLFYQQIIRLREITNRLETPKIQLPDSPSIEDPIQHQGG